MVAQTLERSRRIRLAGAILTLLLLAVLLFTRLGHYALWDDETMGALVAKGVLRTGDTSALVDDHNVVAYRGGILLNNYRDRSTPPLATYITAGSFALFGVNAWSARLPFAFLGLATGALLLWWFRKRPIVFYVSLCLGLLCTVSLLLAFRQCRYYGSTIFFCTLVAYLYCHLRATREGRQRDLLLLALASSGLFVSNYMTYVAVYSALGLDFLIWRWRELRLGVKDLAVWFLPQIVINGAIASVWNPFKTAFGDYVGHNTLSDRFLLFLWNWRDLNVCEFLALPALIVAVVLGFRKSTWLVRCCVGLAVVIAAITIVSPQLIQNTSAADVRYLYPVMPLAIVIEAGVLALIFRRKRIIGIACAVLLFATNILSSYFWTEKITSTAANFVGELINPPLEPYTPTAQWIRENTKPGATVWVIPDYATYPLMFHAPEARYVWQVDPENRRRFSALAPEQFMGSVPPDYIVVFGPSVQNVLKSIEQWHQSGVSYDLVANLDYFWKDMYRPELFWRTFRTIKGYDPKTYGVFILRKNS